MNINDMPTITIEASELMLGHLVRCPFDGTHFVIHCIAQGAEGTIVFLGTGVINGSVVRNIEREYHPSQLVSILY